MNLGYDMHPPTTIVSHIRNLQELVSTYPDQLIAQRISMIKEYKYYRSIHGDGNCFYRAFAFLYLTRHAFTSFESCFEEVPIVTRDCPIGFSETNFTDVLRQLWVKYILPSIYLKVEQRENQIQKAFNTSFIFDTVLVTYFRSVNYNSIKNHHYSLKEFMNESLDKQLRKVSTFYAQSQGVQIYSLARHYDVKLKIVVALKNQLHQNVYMENASICYVMLFRPGHYDILYDYQQQGWWTQAFNILNPKRKLPQFTDPKTYYKTEPQKQPYNKKYDFIEDQSLSQNRIYAQERNKYFDAQRYGSKRQVNIIQNQRNSQQFPIKGTKNVYHWDIKSNDKNFQIANKFEKDSNAFKRNNYLTNKSTGLQGSKSYSQISRNKKQTLKYRINGKMTEIPVSKYSVKHDNEFRGITRIIIQVIIVLGIILFTTHFVFA